jgi:AcrR family transcriptional regulator
MDSSLDRRVVRTRILLQDALLELIFEHGYETIRVQDITERANLGRATFYVHYADKEALLHAMIERLRDELSEQIQRTPENSLLPGFRTLFHHAATHPTFYRVVLNQVDGRRYITNVLIVAVLETLQQQDSRTDTPHEFIAHYIVGAVLQLLDWWLTNDKPYSIEEMEDLLFSIVQSGLPGLFRIST